MSVKKGSASQSTPSTIHRLKSQDALSANSQLSLSLYDKLQSDGTLRLPPRLAFLHAADYTVPTSSNPLSQESENQHKETQYAISYQSANILIFDTIAHGSSGYHDDGSTQNPAGESIINHRRLTMKGQPNIGLI